MSYKVEQVATVYRGEAIEAIHHGSVAVINIKGQLTHYFGDPEFATITRSCIKPFQLMPLLTSGAADRFGFSPEQLAVMCGSHIGSDHHRAVVISNLKAADHDVEDLQCGCHWPLGMMMSNDYPLHEEDKDTARHNCSGKHSGFLALARFLGDDKANYLSPESRTQMMVMKAVSDFCEYPLEKMPIGIDGCSAPNFPLALRNLALGFMKLANALSDDLILRPAMNRIREAMWSFPEMVSGKGRFDLALMRSFPNNVVCKIGAEAVEGIGFSDPSLGIAVKIHDGNDRALGTVCISALKQLGIIGNIDDFPLLKPYENPEVRNVRDFVTGHIVPKFKLKRI